MELSIEEFLYSIDLPKSYFDANFDMKNRFREEADKYLEFVNELDIHFKNEEEKSKYETKLMDSKNAIKENIESINEIFRYYEESNFKNAQTEMDHLMNRIKNVIFIVSPKDIMKINLSDNRTAKICFRGNHSDRYYRIRSVETRKTEIESNKNELFHIPYSKRAYCSNERFSLAGFPSLYLSTSLQIAWQECRYPKSYYFSEYEYKLSNNELKESFNVLALYSPNEILQYGISERHNNFDIWLNIFIRYLIQYPLILACSFVNHRGDAPFKQEYIIPQLLLQWVKRNYETIKGISYFSCVDLKLFDRKWSGYNLVFPVIDGKDEYSKDLRKLFEWSDPKFYSLSISEDKIVSKTCEILDDYILELRTFRNTLKVYEGDNQNVENIITSLIELCSCFYDLLKNINTTNAELFLHIINMLKHNFDQEEMIYTSLNELLKKANPELDKSLDHLFKKINLFEYVKNALNDCIKFTWNFPIKTIEFDEDNMPRVIEDK